jgi:hypothetical protein
MCMMSACHAFLWENRQFNHNDNDNASLLKSKNYAWVVSICLDMASICLDMASIESLNFDSFNKS